MKSKTATLIAIVSILLVSVSVGLFLNHLDIVIVGLVVSGILAYDKL